MRHSSTGLDWDTGEIGEHLADLKPRQDTLGYLPIAIGTAEHLFLTNGDELIALEPDSDTVAWQIELGERAVRDSAVLDGIAVFRDSPGWTVDAATGTELREGPIPGIHLTVLGGRLAGAGPSEIALVELP